MAAPRSSTAPHTRADMTQAAPRAEEATSYLRIERLVKQFGSFTALKDISLEILAGEFVCFLGPSGCGKTTLLRAIAGLDIQTSGRIFQAGQEISTLPASQRDFGIVFQSYALFPNLTVSDNVAYGLVSRRVPKVEIQTRVVDLLQLVGMPESARKYPAQLSGGQQQRVALARALALSPGLLLLDEPLSALDARVRSHLRSEIRQLHRRLGVTTILVTHDQEEALTMADRIVVMNQGVIEQVGTPTEVYRSPRSAFVADFVGTTNFLPAVVTGSSQVRYAGIDLACELDVRPGVGHDVTLAVRPEDIAVRSVAAGMPNALAVRVADVEFLGSFCRIKLAVDGSEAPIVADFSINLVRDLAIAVGKELLIALPRERLRVFPRAPKLP
jgi:iron(III) transport system ATP-binding protein